MLNYLFIALFSFGLSTSPQPNHHHSKENSDSTKKERTIKLKKKKTLNTRGKTLSKRFAPPAPYKRKKDKSHFAKYLRKLPLKPHGSRALIYDGREKTTNKVYEAVVKLPIGKKDLHQRADAIMRLRAEYLWKEKKYDQIHFNFANGFRVDYTEWMQGKRIEMNQNEVSWIQKETPSNTYQDFWNYLETVFAYAGTNSLEKELQPVSMNDMQIGDVFIKGEFPGHAIIVVDMAIDRKTGKKLFMLAQSYMPAQETQVLKNPLNPDLSPWYSTDFDGVLETPEWNFTKSDLKRFSSTH